MWTNPVFLWGGCASPEWCCRKADSARSSGLAYAAHRNPAITAILWPYALRHASYVRRIMPREHHSKSPQELFTGSPVRPTTKFLHAFGCPVYVLQDALQSGNSIPKWDQRSRVGVYLGQSAQHDPNVSLILNPRTGHISPLFHCVYDDTFDSAKSDANLTTHVWAEKAGLRTSTSEPELEPAQRDYVHTSIPPVLQVPFASNQEHSPPDDPALPSQDIMDDDFPATDDLDIDDPGEGPAMMAKAPQTEGGRGGVMDDDFPATDDLDIDDPGEGPAMMAEAPQTEGGRGGWRRH